MRKAVQWGYSLLLACASLGAVAAQGPNTAHIIQNISVPGMTVAINPGGAGCNTVAHEVWEPAQGGCSDIEYQKSTARVISVTPSATSMEAGAGTTTFVAQVTTQNGKAAPPGVVVKWTTSNGNLGVPQGVTDGNGQAQNSLSGAASGAATVTATAAGGGATTTIAVQSSKPVIDSFDVVAQFNKRSWPNTVWIDGYYGYYYDFSIFTWTVTGGADRYVVKDNTGYVLYSGTATTFSTNYVMNIPNRFSGVYTLTAYKGSESTTRTLTATVRDNGCYGCSM